MRSIAVYSLKGGVGKTTLVSETALAALWGAIEKRLARASG